MLIKETQPQVQEHFCNKPGQRFGFIMMIFICVVFCYHFNDLTDTSDFKKKLPLRKSPVVLCHRTYSNSPLPLHSHPLLTMCIQFLPHQPSPVFSCWTMPSHIRPSNPLHTSYVQPCEPLSPPGYICQPVYSTICYVRIHIKRTFGIRDVLKRPGKIK